MLILELVDNFQEMCSQQESAADHFKDCVLKVSRKVSGAFALLAYIPALCVCLYHIDRLDAVMDTIETIWELEDIQRAVRAFDRSMEEVSEQVVLLKAVNERVLTRMNIVVKFGGRVGGMMHSQGAESTEVLIHAVWQLVACLEQTAADLMPVEEWLQLSHEDQNECAAKVQQSIDELNMNMNMLAAGNFGVARRSTVPRSSDVAVGSGQVNRSLAASIEMRNTSFNSVTSGSDASMTDGTFCAGSRSDMAGMDKSWSN